MVKNAKAKAISRRDNGIDMAFAYDVTYAALIGAKKVRQGTCHATL